MHQVILKTKAKTTNLLEEKIGEHLWDLGVHKDFFRLRKALTIKEKKLVNRIL